MEHEVFVPVPAERLREALADPVRVARAVPGLQQDAGAEPVTGRLKVRVGGHTITYRGSARLSAQDDGSYAVEGDATESRGTGAVKLALTLRVDETDGGSTLTFDATASADGRVTELPPESVTSAVTRLLNRFAENLAATAEPKRGVRDPAGPSATEATESPAAERAEPPAAADADASAPRAMEDAGPSTAEGADLSDSAEAVPAATQDAEPSVAEGTESPAAESAERDAPPAAERADLLDSAEAVPQATQDAEPSAAESADSPAAESADSPAAESVERDAPPVAEGADVPDPAEAVRPAAQDADATAPANSLAPEATEDPEPSATGDSEAGPDVEDGSGPVEEPTAADAAAASEAAAPETPDALDEPASQPSGFTPDLPAEAAHARRTMIGRSAEEVDHAPPRGRYAPVPAPQTIAPNSALRWAAPAAALVVASAIVVSRVLRKRR